MTGEGYVLLPNVDMCNSSGYLFVADHEVGVYVFKPSGEHVASLSLASSGGMKYPAGIAIDDDGFVYVCDFFSIENRDILMIYSTFVVFLLFLFLSL